MTSDRYAYILIADRKYWKRLCQKRDPEDSHSFVRRNKVAPKATEHLLFYIKKPVMRILGGAVFLERFTGQTEELWAKYGAETCFKSYAEYVEFVQNRIDVTFVRFTHLYELDSPKSTEEIRPILGNLQGFRGKYINKATADQLRL